MRPRLLGSPRVTGCACFHARRRDWLTRRPLKRTGTDQVHSPSRLLLHRVPSTRYLLVSFDPSDTCQDFCPHSTSLSSVRFRARTPDLAPCRPQVLSTSRRFSPLQSSRACFIPQPSPGLTPVQGLVHTSQPRSLFESPCPLAVASGPLTRKRVAGISEPRPRGLSPCGAAGRELGS